MQFEDPAENITMETLDDIQANIGALAPGHNVEVDEESLVIYKTRAKELRIKRAPENKFRVSVRSHNQAKFENIGGGNLVDFNGVLAEIGKFTLSE